ncbi:FxDxF family PEP-CTERM protein [Methylobacillus caricis]|uniref:FxDxF family PEP-CTERM protein n=1 Tax=Methylobacillus caricis TaxID=1971611 RepID=UPI001D0017B3|nr:FxDxF family PEP-CTERM protein [Methylobacillus caricis]MCB5188744.1 FxDxF family PEP-CTERM protein [Methylobacillus caricis]
MSVINKLIVAGVVALSAFSAVPALAANPYNVYITEWSYQSAHSSELGEYIELSNLGTTDVDFTNWSYDDDSRNSLTFNLSDFGIVKAGESVIVTEIGADEFRARWGLDDSVKVIGFLNPNLGRADEINIYDNELNLVDRLTYGDNTIGGIRARYNSGIPTSVDVLGANNVQGWVLSQVGDSEGSWRSTVGDIGSPGQTNLTIAAVPEPETYALMLAGLGLVGFAARRRKAA